MAWSDTGCDVDTGKQSASSILFSKTGQATVRQIETSESMEVRGLTETAGKGKVPSAQNIVDNTVQTTYYAYIDDTVYTINVTTGSKETWSAARKDDSGQWVATKTTQTYDVKGLAANVWGTTPIDKDGQTITLSASGTSQVLSREKSAQFAYNAEGDVLTTTVTTEVREIKYIDTKAHADAIVNANTEASGHGYASHTGTLSVSVPIVTGAEKVAASRYVSEKEGWTVTVTTKTYGKSGTRWS